jgi:hypothetical protein
MAELESLRVALAHWRLKLRARGHEVGPERHQPILMAYLRGPKVPDGLSVASAAEPVAPVDTWPGPSSCLKSTTVDG